MKRRSMMGLLLILAVLSASPGSLARAAQPVPAATQPVSAPASPADPNFEPLAHIGGKVKPGPALANGSTVYIATNTLSVVDASDPAAPHVLGTLDLALQAPSSMDMYLDGTLLYIVYYNEGLKIVDVSDPAAPLLRGQYNGLADAFLRDVVAADGRAYLSYNHTNDNQQTGGLAILDVHDPSHPALLRDFSTCAGDAMAMVGGLLYRSSNCGLQIIDVSAAQNPVIVNTYSGSSVWNLVLGAGVAYVAVTDPANPDLSSLQVLSLSDPRHPALVYQEAQQGAPLALDGNLLYLSNRDVLDVSNPAAPVKVAAFADSVYGFMAAGGGMLYMSERIGGISNGVNELAIYDMHQPSSPIRYAPRMPITNLSGLRVAGTTMYTYGLHGIQIVDVADPRHPRMLGHYRTYKVEDIEVAGSWAYVAGSGAFMIMDVSDPQLPVVHGRISYTASVDVEISGATAYLGLQPCYPLWPPNQCNSFRAQHALVDVSDPAQPVLSGEYEHSGNSPLSHLEVAGGWLYAGLTGGLSAYNLASGATQLSPIGSKEDFEIVGQRLFAAGPSGLTIYDAATPPILTPLSSVALSSSLDIEISGTLAYLASGTAGVEVVSLADPVHPHLLASYPTFAAASDVEVVGDLIYVAEGDGGAEILRYIGPSETVITLTPAGGSLSSPDGRLTVSFPAGAVSAPVRLALLDYPRPPHALSLREHAVRTFALTATGAGGPLAELAQPYALNLHYTPAQLQAQAVPESTLGLAMWAGGAWQDAPCGICVFSPQTDQLSVSSPTLGTFALRGRPFQVLMPVVQR